MNKLILQIFILAAFWCQSLMPAGYMPSFGQEGQGTIVLCSIEGFKTVVVGTDKIPASEQEDRHTFAFCSYAVSAHKDTIIAINSYTHDLYLLAFDYNAPDDQSYGPIIARAYYARGPPAFS